MHSLTSNILYVGCEDDNLDLFEGQYPIPNGISYNSYLISDDIIAIIDAVDARRTADWLNNIENALANSGRVPQYLIVQHVEPDHSGSIRAIMDRYPDIKIATSSKAVKMLSDFFEDIDFPSRSIVINEGDTLTLGKTTLSFINAPMVHWPEVIMTLDESQGVLFSADAFGSFAMSTSPDAWDAEARRYYTNIVGRFGNSVQAVLKKLADKKLGIIAPLHGPALTDNLSRHLTLYDKWSRYEPETQGVLVAYASIYGGTAEAARRIAAILEAEGAGEIIQFDLCRHHVSYAVSETFRLSHLLLCSVTYDGTLFPAMQEFLHHLEMKNMRNRVAALVENGSWAPQAGRLMKDTLGKLKNITIVEPTITIHSRLHKSDLPMLQALAANLTKTQSI